MKIEDALDLDELEYIPTPSKFVDRLSWSFILLSGLYSIYGLYSLIVFIKANALNQVNILAENISVNYDLSILNWIVDFYLKYQKIFDLFFLVGAIFLLIASIGLLNRKKIARTVFISLLYLHLVYSLIRMVAIIYFARLARSISNMEPYTSWSIGDIAEWVLIAYPTYTIILYFLYRWIHRKLKQPTIRAEFS